MCWISERIAQTGGVASIRQWTGMINWIHDVFRSDKPYKSNTDFVKYISDVKKQFGEPSGDIRHPFKLEHIINFTKDKKVVPGNYFNVPFNDLAEVLVVQLYFGSASRPSELARDVRSTRRPGLRSEHYQSVPLAGDVRAYTNLTICSFKNQKVKKQYKQMIIGNTACDKRLLGRDCFYFNPFLLLKILRARRRQLYAKKQTQLGTVTHRRKQCTDLGEWN
eukprot:326752_1